MIEISSIREVLAMLGDAALVVLVVITLMQTRVLLIHHTRLTKIETKLESAPCRLSKTVE